MTPATPPDRRTSAARRRRHAVFALLAAALVVFAMTITFGLSTNTPTAPPQNPATAVAVQQRAAASGSPNAAEVAPPAPELARTATAGPQAAEAPAPESPPPATTQDSAPPASAPAVPAPFVASPMPAQRESVAPDTPTSVPNPVPVPAKPAPSAVAAAAQTWMRRLFGLFLDHASSRLAALSEAQRDALFAEFLAWRRARDSADHAQPDQPGPENLGKAQQP